MVGRVGPGERGVFQNVNVLFAMIGSGGRTGPTFRTGQTGSFFRELLLHRKAMSVQVGGGFRGRTGSFSGGGAVMAPLRRAGLRGSLLFQGDRSD